MFLKAFNILKLGNKPIKMLATFLTEGTKNKVAGSCETWHNCTIKNTSGV